MLFTSRVCPSPGARARYVVLLLLAACPPPVFAESSPEDQVTLEWSAGLDPGITGYKLYYGTESGNYTQIRDVGDSLSTGLSSLIPDTTYFCTVTVYNSSGLESPFSEEFSFSYTPPTTTTYPTEQLVLLDAADVPEQGNTLEFEVSMETDYVVWCRLKSSYPDNDAVLMTFDDGHFEVLQIPAPLSSDWIWAPLTIDGSSPRIFSLSEGSHTLTVGLPATTTLDRIVLTSALEFTPTDELPRSGEAVFITKHPVSRAITPGADATFVVSAVATGPVSYQWRKNGQSLPGADTPDFAISGATSDDAGDYSVVVSSGSAVQHSNAAVLQVVSAPPGLRIHQLSIAAGGMVTLNVLGEIGTSLEIFASSDMINWQSIATVNNSDGLITVADPLAESQLRRFYRIAKAVEK